MAGFLSEAWGFADPYALHANARALVDLPDEFAKRFLALEIPRVFIYGQETYPPNSGKVTNDAPDPDLLKAAGIDVRVVPNAGHNLMLGNPDGFVEILVDMIRR